MTGNLNSKLAESSDIVISSAVEQEACPNQLAPTSSTTVQMALGDALAICLMELRDFKDTDFPNTILVVLWAKPIATVAQFLFR